MLGGLLGAYGSDEEEGSQLSEDHEGTPPPPPPRHQPLPHRCSLAPAETQKTGQVTLLGDDESGEHGGLDLSHLTGAAARAPAVADTAAAVRGEDAQPAAPGAAPMDVDGGAAAGATGAAGGEQPPAGGELAAGQEEGEAAAAAAPEDPRDALPPEMRDPPEGECYPDIQARVVSWLNVQRTKGKFINEEIRKSRGYRNPEFFAKMVEHLEIDQYGTAFDPQVFDPAALPPEDYLDALQKEWAAEEERRKAARAAGHGRVEFHKSASNPSLVQPALKPGLQAGAPQVVTAAALAAQAAAAQQARAGMSQAGINTAAAVAAAQARAAALAKQMVQRRG